MLVRKLALSSGTDELELLTKGRKPFTLDDLDQVLERAADSSQDLWGARSVDPDLAEGKRDEVLPPHAGEDDPHRTALVGPVNVIIAAAMVERMLRAASASPLKPSLTPVASSTATAPKAAATATATPKAGTTQRAGPQVLRGPIDSLHRPRGVEACTGCAG